MEDIGGGLMDQAGDVAAKTATDLGKMVAQSANRDSAVLISSALANRGGEVEKGRQQDEKRSTDANQANKLSQDFSGESMRASSQQSSQNAQVARQAGAELKSLEAGQISRQQVLTESRLANLTGNNKLPGNINTSAGAEQFIKDMAKHNQAADGRRADQAADRMNGKLAQQGLPQLSADARTKLTTMLKLEQQMARLKQAQQEAKLMGDKGAELEKALGEEMAKVEGELQEAQEALPEGVSADLAQEAGDEVESERRTEDGDNTGQTGDKETRATKEGIDRARSGDEDTGGQQQDTAGQSEQAPVQAETVPLAESFARLQPVFSSGAEGTRGAQGAEGELDAHANVVALGVIVGGQAMVDPQSGEIRRVKGMMERGRNPSDAEDFGKLADPEGHAKADGLGLGTGIRPGQRSLSRGGSIYATNTWQIRRSLETQGGDRIMLPNGQSITRDAALAEVRQDDMARVALVRGLEINPGSWYHNAAGFA
jgi:hypothetical protein